MSEVNVPFGDNREETATLLLAAAEDTDTPVHLIRVTDTGFKAPREVAEKAGLDTDDGEMPNAALQLGDDAPDDVKDGRMLPPGTEDNQVGGERDRPDVSSGNDSEDKPAKKTAAKKSTAKKTTARKRTAKKTATKKSTDKSDTGWKNMSEAEKTEAAQAGHPPPPEEPSTPAPEQKES